MAAESTSTTIPSFCGAALLALLQVYYLSTVWEAAASQEPFEWPSSSISLTIPAVVTSLYLIGIFAGKHLMKTREAFELQGAMMVYNLFQSLFNIYCVFYFIYEVWSQGLPVWGTPMEKTLDGYRIGFIVWAHYNNKYIELCDTLFMVLRKKNKQISFLHVYHHTLLIWSWAAVCKYAGGGDCYFGALMNSIIHVVMYSYYFMRLLKMRCPWKRHVTNLQLLQFCVCFSHSCWVLYYNTYPRALALLEMFVMCNMLVLFGNFYYQQYIKKGQAAKATATTPAAAAAVPATSDGKKTAADKSAVDEQAATTPSGLRQRKKKRTPRSQ